LRKGEEVKRRWLIFHCDHDDCWIVSRLDEGSDICLGVAECPDKRTAEAVAEAMRLRDSELRELRELVGDGDPLPDPPEPGSPGRGTPRGNRRHDREATPRREAGPEGGGPTGEEACSRAS